MWRYSRRRAEPQTNRQQVPLFEPDPLWSQALPNRWVTGAIGGVAVDSHDNVWVFHRQASIPDGEKAASLTPPQAECCIPAPAVLEFGPNGRFLQAWGGPGHAPPQFNNPVHAVSVSNDNLVYVADRTNNRLQVFRLDGTFVKETFIARNTLQAEGTVHHFAMSPDKEQKFLYVVDGSNKAVRVLNRQTLEIVANVGGHAGHNTREFFHVHSAATDSKGNLFLGEVNTGQRYCPLHLQGRWARPRRVDS